MLEEQKPSTVHEQRPEQLPEAEQSLFLTLLPAPHQKKRMTYRIIGDPLKSPSFGASL